MKNLFLIIIIAAVAYGVNLQKGKASGEQGRTAQVAGDSILQKAFKNKQSDIQVTGQGKVIKIK